MLIKSQKVSMKENLEEQTVGYPEKRPRIIHLYIPRHLAWCLAHSRSSRHAVELFCCGSLKEVGWFWG